MRATSGLDGDTGQAVRTILRCRLLWCSLLLSLELVDFADEKEDGKCDYDKANEYYEKALTIRLDIFGEKHLNVAKGYNNLGRLKRIQSKYADAVKYHEDALTVQKQIFGERHPEIADSYNFLGIVYREKEDYDFSLQHFQNAIIANVPSFSTPEP